MVGLMVTALAIGIRRRQPVGRPAFRRQGELGLVPLGAIFMGLFCLAPVARQRVVTPGSIAVLSLLGLAAACFIVPY